MNHFVPEFETDEDYVNVHPNSSSLNLPRKPILNEDDELMELLWHNGQVVLQNQRLNNPKKPSSSSSSVKLNGGGGEATSSLVSLHQQSLDQNLLIQEDEMTSWLLNPLREEDFCSDLLFSASPNAPCVTMSERETTTMTHVTSSRPPVPSVKPKLLSTRPPVRNFMNFSRLRGNSTGESAPSISKAIVRESTQVSPTSTPSASQSDLIRRKETIDSRMTMLNCRSSSDVAGESVYTLAIPGHNQKGKSVATTAPPSESDLTRRKEAIDSRVTMLNCRSSSAVAGSSMYTLAISGHNQKGKAVVTAAPASETPVTSSSVAPKNETEPGHAQPETEKTIADERKRKEREATGETECRSEETKQGRGGSTTSTKRSRAAEVHNLSERKRRDRINERMKALQQLIPRCNKSDKASMLDEAIEYMKSLQLQVQMMSMGCGMMPMMYPGMQQYMPHMAMGMGMNHPLPPPPPPSFMPFPNMLAAQRPLPTPTHMGSSGPHYPVHASDPSRVFIPNQQCDPTSSQPQFPGYMDPYQQFRSLHPTQPTEFQNQATSYPSSSRVSSSKESEDHGNHTTG